MTAGTRRTGAFELAQMMQMSVPWRGVVLRAREGTSEGQWSASTNGTCRAGKTAQLGQGDRLLVGCADGLIKRAATVDDAAKPGERSSQQKR